MKIAHVIVTFPPAVGGMGQVAYEEAKRLTARGHQVTIFTMDDTFWMADESFQVVRIKPWLKAGDAGLVPSLFSQLNNFDVVHLHYPWYGGAEWVALRRLLGQKFVATYHMDAVPVWWKRGIQDIYDTLVAPFIFLAASRVIGVDADHLAATSFGKKITARKKIILENGVDTVTFAPRAEKIPVSLQSFVGKKIFLFVGNPLPFKRLDRIIAAVQSIADESVVLAVVGGGYDLEKYKAQVRKAGIEHRVQFVGRVTDRKELNSFYQAAHCLVVASDRGESFSLVAVEALSAGCPVIASDIPGVRGRVVPGVDGLVFNHKSTAALADAISTMAAKTKSERDAMGAAGRVKVLAKNTWDEHVSVLEKIYLSV